MTVLAPLVVPKVKVANVRLLGEMLTAAEPVPARLTVWGLLAASSVNVSVPVRAPTAVGENVTPTVHVAPTASPVPHVLLATVKSPVAAILLKLRDTFWRFVNVTVFAALVLPTAAVPRFKLLTERVTGAIPVPVRLT